MYNEKICPLRHINGIKPFVVAFEDKNKNTFEMSPYSAPKQVEHETVPNVLYFRPNAYYVLIL